jgi:hypothetical protein
MFDSIFDLIIVFIPLAIFIGRVVLQAQAKHKPAPAKKQPLIPVHFEDYDDEDKAPFAPSAVSRPVIKHKDRADTYNPPLSIDRAPKPAIKKSKVTVEPVKGFLGLDDLSPIKQAVVMAEILGPPKGI